MKEQNTVEILSCSRCDELKARVKVLEKALEFYKKYPEGDLGVLAKQALTDNQEKEVCIYTAVGDNYYDSQCGIAGELITDTHCRKCGLPIKEN